MKIEILQPEFAEAYNQFLLNHRCSLFYYSSKYKDFLKTLQSDWVEILVSLCVPALQQALLRSPWKLPTAWCYRVAFLISTSLGVAFWNHHGFWQLIGAIFSAYLGGLLAIALEYGLWEINLSPSLHVKNEVRQHHLQLIGKPRSGPLLKHLFDAIIAATGLILFAPFWLLIIFLIWFEDPGPVFFVKNSVGKGGINFSQIKFRTMISNAEETTGPTLAREHDNWGEVRVTGLLYHLVIYRSFLA